MGKGRPFQEVFASILHEDYGFPALEIVAFIYTLGSFLTHSLLLSQPTGPRLTVVSLVVGSTGPMGGALTTIFGILILKNIAYSLGNDLERGVIQNLLSYPLNRRSILTAKILSSFGVPLVLLVGIQISVFFVFASDIAFSHTALVLIASSAAFTYAVLVGSIVLILTLFFRKGIIALMVGIALYFSSMFLAAGLVAVAGGTGSDIALKGSAILIPALAFQAHYQVGALDPSIRKLWTPSLTEALLYVGAGYVLSILILTVGYLYFEKRLEI